MKQRILAVLAAAGLAATCATAQTIQTNIGTIFVPAGNPQTADKALLGRVLFWDEQLSMSGTVACGTCHLPEFGGTDARSRGPGALRNPGLNGVFGDGDDVVGSPGVPLRDAVGNYVASAFGFETQVTGRKAPPTINAAFLDELFWDGRAGGAFVDPDNGTTVLLPLEAALESQAAGPPVSDVEMGHAGLNWPTLSARIGGANPLALATNLPTDIANFIQGRTYPDLFNLAFGSPDVSSARICMAIAAYERTLISDQSPVDDYLNGNVGALTPQEVQGLQLFVDTARTGCNDCHTLPLTTDFLFHNIGVRPIFEDQGRFTVSGDPADLGAFRTSSIRNVRERAPYFHNGSAATLMDVVDFYNRGGDFRQGIDPLIRPLGLSLQERQALVAFMEAMSDPRVVNGQAPFTRPTLFSERPVAPARYGVASPGSGGVTPAIHMVDPAIEGNPLVGIALSGGVGGAPAYLVLDEAAAPTGGIPILGIQSNLALTGNQLVFATKLLSGAGAGNGSTTHLFAIPSSGLLGTYWFGQWVVLDSGVPAGLSATRGVSFSIF